MASSPHYVVIIRPEAEEDLRAITAYIATNSPDAAHQWLDLIREAIEELAYMPSRFPAAREAGQVLVDIRQRVEGNYRIIFELRKRDVIILGIRHAARRPMDL